MTEQTLARARAGDEDAFRELTDPYRRELQLHVYRIVGSAQDAEDLLQETLLAAWRGLEQFEGRASVRAWLYRIATNRSLDALRASRRRPEEPADAADARADALERAVVARALPRRSARGDPGRGSRTGGALRDQGGDRARVRRRPSASPAAAARGARAARRAGLPRRARSPRCSRRARRRSTACCAARVRRSNPACRPPDASGRRSRDSRLERDIVGRFAETVEAGDIDGMVALLTDDAWLTMPPLPHAYQGHERDRRVPARLRASAAARRCGWCRRAPTANRRSAATSRRPRPTSRARSRCSC